MTHSGKQITLPDTLGMAEQLALVYQQIVARAGQVRDRFPAVNQEAEISRDNLLAYLALREFDLQDLQHQLAEEGLSSLGRLEANAVAHIEKVLGHLEVGVQTDSRIHRPDLAQAGAISEKRSLAVLGRPKHPRRTCIMVTLDPFMFKTPDIFRELLENGMDLARINCAHGTRQEWRGLIAAVRLAEEQLRKKGLYENRHCKIYMDLGGPKIRIGQFERETSPLKISVRKDLYGKRSSVVQGYLDLEAACTGKHEDELEPVAFTIAVSGVKNFKSLSLGDTLTFVDTRNKLRSFSVIGILGPTRLKVIASRTCYVTAGTQITGPNDEILSVRDLRAEPVQITVKRGDRLKIYRDPQRLGHVASNAGPAGVAAAIPEALNNVKVGDRVFIDDGKIGGTVEELNEDEVLLKILFPTLLPCKVREEKGLNFPNTFVDLPALTQQDIQDLEFVVQHVDTVGLSFVHSPQDLHDLAGVLHKLGRSDLAVVAKIETSEAIQNLASILLAGLNFPSFGVMIARGDLAVEVGFDNLSIVQEDILCMCDAAHVPVIWATQVLETLAKKGVPARAEITDAAMGVRAECVMLNKGPHIAEAVNVLSRVLTMGAQHHVKKRQVFKKFTNQKGVFEVALSGHPEEN